MEEPSESVVRSLSWIGRSSFNRTCLPTHNLTLYFLAIFWWRHYGVTRPYELTKNRQGKYSVSFSTIIFFLSYFWLIDCCVAAVILQIWSNDNSLFRQFVPSFFVVAFGLIAAFPVSVDQPLRFCFALTSLRSLPVPTSFCPSNWKCFCLSRFHSIGTHEHVQDKNTNTSTSLVGYRMNE